MNPSHQNQNRPHHEQNNPTWPSLQSQYPQNQQPQTQNHHIRQHRRLLHFPLRLHPADLPPNKRDCPICTHVLGIPNEDSVLEVPIQLPCGHVFGDACFERWLQGEGEGNGEGDGELTGWDRCPYCRARLEVMVEWVRVDGEGKVVESWSAVGRDAVEGLFGTEALERMALEG